MNHKVIFFDADGVILKGAFKFTDLLAEKYGLKLDNMLPFFQGPFQDCALGKADVREELASVVDQWGWPGTVDELLDFWLSEGTVFDEEMIKLARKLNEKGLHCFVSTGQERERGEHIKNRVGNGDPFKDVYYSAEVGFGKKDPRFWEVIFKRVEQITTNPSEILVIDDSQSVLDVAAGLGADTLFVEGSNDLSKLRKYANH
jgi:putative hydrolase of the HAD superfamily